jgi:hypothetical protein
VAEDRARSGKYGTAVVTVRGSEKTPAGGTASDGMMIEPVYTSTAKEGTKTFRAKGYDDKEAKTSLTWRATGGSGETWT